MLRHHCDSLNCVAKLDVKMVKAFERQPDILLIVYICLFVLYI